MSVLQTSVLCHTSAHWMKKAKHTNHDGLCNTLPEFDDTRNTF